MTTQGHGLFFGLNGYKCECGWVPHGGGLTAEANHRDHVYDVTLGASRGRPPLANGQTPPPAAPSLRGDDQ